MKMDLRRLANGPQLKQLEKIIPKKKTLKFIKDRQLKITKYQIELIKKNTFITKKPLQ